MMSLLKPYYRIVRDAYAGYEVQTWRWWFPIWIQGWTNTHFTKEAAEEWARNRSAVKYLGQL